LHFCSGSISKEENAVQPELAAGLKEHSEPKLNTKAMILNKDM
jgi:hypothetical protein